MQRVPALGDLLYVADPGVHSVVIFNLGTGTKVSTIGEGVQGYQNGDFASARFRNPSAVAFSSENVSSSQGRRLLQYGGGYMGGDAYDDYMGDDIGDLPDDIGDYLPDDPGNPGDSFNRFSVNGFFVDVFLLKVFLLTGFSLTGFSLMVFLLMGF